MSEKIVVVALGHRALGTTSRAEVATKAAAKAIADRAKVVISQQWPRSA